MAKKTDKIDITDYLDKYRLNNDKDAGKKILWQYLQDIMNTCTHAFYGNDTLIEKYKDFVLDYYLRQIGNLTFLISFSSKTNDIEKELKKYITRPFVKNGWRYVDFCRNELSKPDIIFTGQDFDKESSISEETQIAETEERPEDQLNTKEDIYITLVKGHHQILKERKDEIAEIVKLNLDEIDKNLNTYDEIVNKIRVDETKIEKKLTRIHHEKVKLLNKLEKQTEDIEETQSKLNRLERERQKLKNKLDKCSLFYENDFCCQFLNTTHNSLYRLKSLLKSKPDKKLRFIK